MRVWLRAIIAEAGLVMVEAGAGMIAMAVAGETFGIAPALIIVPIGLTNITIGSLIFVDAVFDTHYILPANAAWR